MSRLRAFAFRVNRGKGWTVVSLFYAETAEEATRYATAWAAPRGYEIQLVTDEELVS